MGPMEKGPLARRIWDVAHLRGDFVLRSGQSATEYFDKFQLMTDPQLLGEIADRLVDLVPAGTEILAGLELGGVPLAAAMALRTGLPAVYVRKQRKTYGTCRITEGTDVAGRRALIVEDVATTGGQMLLSAAELRAEGAVINDALVVIDREQGAPSGLTSEGITLHSLFTRSQLEEAGRQPPARR